MRPVKRRYRFVRVGRLVPRLLSAVKELRRRCAACASEVSSANHRAL